MIDALDKKADDLMRTILTVFGAALAVATTRIIQLEVPWLYSAVLGLITLAFGVVIAAAARIPAPLETPMSPRELMAVSDLHMLPSRSQVQSAPAASYHLAFLGAKIMNKWKTTQLKRANRFFLTGLMLLPLSVGGNFWTAKPRRQGLDMKFELRTVSRTSQAGQAAQRLSPPGVSLVKVDSVGTKDLKTVPLGCTCADPMRPPGTGAWPVGRMSGFPAWPAGGPDGGGVG
jgi:hypothetical protein